MTDNRENNIGKFFAARLFIVLFFSLATPLVVGLYLFGSIGLLVGYFIGTVLVFYILHRTEKRLLG